MNTLTKLALGMMGRLQPKAPESNTLTNIVLPPPENTGGLGLMDALQRRQSQRAFLPELLGPDQQILLTQTVGQPKPSDA